MNALLFALALAAQDPAPPSEAAPPETPAAQPATQDRLPAGAPREDYPFVAWCYGALRGHIDLHDEMMPEVTRIESQFRKPGAKLEDDLAVYEQMRADGRVRLEQFQAALTAAEKASVRPINAIGGQAVRQGRQIWAAGPEVTRARKAQEWMSWALPARCETVAASLESRSILLGATLKANAVTDPAAEPPQSLRDSSPEGGTEEQGSPSSPPGGEGSEADGEGAPPTP